MINRRNFCASVAAIASFGMMALGMSRRPPRELNKDQWGNVIALDLSDDNSALGILGNWAQSTTYRWQRTDGNIQRSLALLPGKPTVMLMACKTYAEVARSQEAIERMRENPMDIDWMYLGDGIEPLEIPSAIYGVPLIVAQGPERRAGVKVGDEWFVFENVC